MKKYLFARNIALNSSIVTNTHNYAFQSAIKNEVKWMSTPKYPWNKTQNVISKFKNIEEIKLSFLYNSGDRFWNNSKFFFDSYPYSNILFQNNNIIEQLKDFDVFFCGSSSLYSINKILGIKKTVYNAHDLFSFYPNKRQSFKKIEKSICDTSSLILTTSEMTKLKLKEIYGLDNKVLNLNHGINLDEFTSLKKTTNPFKNSRPIAIFVGSQTYLDTSFIIEVIQKIKNKVNFIFIGPFSSSVINLFSKLENVKFLGSKKRTELINYYNISSVGIINYPLELKKNRLLGTNPMKRYDYAAAGLQTVSTSLFEYELNPSPMYISDNVSEYANFILEAISKPRYSKSELKSFAETNQWSTKFLQLENHLFND